jgi:hypothetical protein
MPEHHVIVKLMPGGGPEPREEVETLVGAGRHAILGTRLPGTEWTAEPPPCFAVVFYNQADGTLDGLVAHILGRRDTMPRTVADIYASWRNEMRAWWTLTKVRRFRPGLTLASIPGCSASNGCTARDSFSGQASFVYWKFTEDPANTLADGS